MPHHCTAPVIPPPVDVKTAADSFFPGCVASMGYDCSGIFCFPSERHSCSAVTENCCCCKLSESCSDDKVPTFVRSGNCNLEMVFMEKIYLSAIHISGIICKPNTSWSVSSEARKHGMDVRF